MDIKHLWFRVLEGGDGWYADIAQSAEGERVGRSITIHTMTHDRQAAVQHIIKTLIQTATALGMAEVGQEIKNEIDEQILKDRFFRFAGPPNPVPQAPCSSGFSRRCDLLWTGIGERHKWCQPCLIRLALTERP